MFLPQTDADNRRIMTFKKSGVENQLDWKTAA
jgi:hypothetical protein